MIEFQTLRYRNILSTGNIFTEIKLNEHPTTLIVGNNGSGKSTFLDALSFALFGKPFRRINKPQLLNSVNGKNLLVEVEFRIGSKHYLIKRGMKPNIFEIWQDETLLNQDAASKDYQEVLEKNILKLNHKSFCQIIVLGSSTFVPFMQLPSGQRREIIEDLLDIQIFSRMNILLKDRILENKNNIQEVKYQLELIKEKITFHKDLLNRLRKNNDERVNELKSKIDAARVKINDYSNLIESQQKLEQELLDSISDREKIVKKRKDYTACGIDLQARKTKLEKEVQFYSNHDNCPTCKQGIEHEFKNETIVSNTETLENINKAISDLEEMKEANDKREDEINSILHDISAIQRKISEYNGHLSSGNQYIKDTTEELTTLEVKSTDNELELLELDKLKLEYKDKEKEREDFLINKEVLDVASVLLKDGGIKAKIIKQYIPVINKLINKYLAIMELPISFELDENFNETLKSRFRDAFSYDSFSEGEKQRIDLAILFTWRAIAKMRNSSNSNLLVMDEIFDSSIDIGGTEQLTSIIESISGDSNIFLISHKENMLDKFTNIIKFEKYKDFSRIAV